MENELQLVRKRAKELKLPFEIHLSNNKLKRYAIIMNGKKINFGHPDYDNYLIHKDEQRRANFHNRFKNYKNYNQILTPMWLSRVLLW